jgi:hypothetical protein
MKNQRMHSVLGAEIVVRVHFSPEIGQTLSRLFVVMLPRKAIL